MELCETIYRIHPDINLALQAKQLGPRFMRHHEVMAEMLYLQGRDEEALDICERLKGLEQLFPRKYIIAAQIFARRGDLEAAAKQYAGMAVNCPDYAKEASNGLFALIKSDPLDDGPPQVLYALYIDQKQLSSEMTRLEALCNSGHADDSAFYALANMYRLSRTYEKEIKLIRQQMVVQPKNPHLLVFLARAYQATHDFTQARDCMDRAVDMASEHTERYRRMRNAMFAGEQDSRQKLEMAARKNVEAGRYHDAVLGYEKLLSRYPAQKSYRLDLAMAIDEAIGQAISARNFDEAVALLERLAHFKDDDSAVEKRLAQRIAQLSPILSPIPKR